MKSIDILWMSMFGIVIFSLIVYSAVEYFSNYAANIRYIKLEIGRAHSISELRYWKGELATMRWCILPWMTPRRARAVRAFFYIGKHERHQSPEAALISMIAPSIVGIVVCASCIVGGTFAWFTASTSTPAATIQSADYTLTYSVNDGHNDVELTQTSPYTVSFLANANTTYTVTVTPDGTATTGYCIIEIDSKKLYTNQFTRQSQNWQPYTFTIPVSAGGNVTLTGQWGTSTYHLNPDITASLK